MPAPPIPCPGPRCTRVVDDFSPSPDFCSNTCAIAWHDANHPTITPIDHGAGRVDGALYGPGQAYRNREDNVLRYALSWLDSRPRPDVAS